MGHVFYDREDELRHCKVCGGAECELPAECPGEPMTENQRALVCAGTLDYCDVGWVARQRDPT